MNTRFGLAVFTLGWVTFGTLAGAEKSRLVPDNPVMTAGLEAELASRSCPGVKMDLDAFRAYTHANGMSHADFYMHKRSRGLEASLAAYQQQLRRNPTTACERLWTDYGAEPHVVQLLRRA